MLSRSGGAALSAAAAVARKAVTERSMVLVEGSIAKVSDPAPEVGTTGTRDGSVCMCISISTAPSQVCPSPSKVASTGPAGVG